jgi:Histidinol dehydrogenase
VLTLGNYLIGPNCMLRTGGHARSWSPLSVLDFMKRASIAHLTRAGDRTLALMRTRSPPTRASMRMPMRFRPCATSADLVYLGDRKIAIDELRLPTVAGPVQK